MVTVADIGGETDGIAITTYNGVYTKQKSFVNDKDWWKHLYSQPGHLNEAEGGTSIYWSDSAERWIIEALDVTWEAPTDTPNSLEDSGIILLID